MVYHDLRSPLANIISSLDILSDLVDADDNEMIQSIMSVATNSTTRIERLVNSLLDINRLESGQKIVNQNVVHLEELIAQAVEEVQPLAESRRQEVAFLDLNNLPSVWVDKDMILRVLVNLLENAAKFTPAGSKIFVDVSKEAGWITVSIEDNGPGIPVLDRERIFDKFTRLRGTHKPGGLGIGLAFCKIAVEGHGGKIWVESQNNVGTTFFFTLPVATRQQQTKPQGD